MEELKDILNAEIVIKFTAKGSQAQLDILNRKMKEMGKEKVIEEIVNEWKEDTIDELGLDGKDTTNLEININLELIKGEEVNE